MLEEPKRFTGDERTQRSTTAGSCYQSLGQKDPENRNCHKVWVETGAGTTDWAACWRRTHHSLPEARLRQERGESLSFSPLRPSGLLPAPSIVNLPGNVLGMGHWKDGLHSIWQGRDSVAVRQVTVQPCLLSLHVSLVWKNAARVHSELQVCFSTGLLTDLSSHAYCVKVSAP